MKGKATPMRIVRTEELAAVGNTRFSRVEAEVSTGESRTVGLVTRDPAVVVLAVDYAQERVALARQGRVGALGALVVEAPAGKIEEGESSLQAARRELEEELGILAERLELVASGLYVSPEYTTERMDLVIATGLRVGRSRPQDDHVEVVWRLFAELDDAIDCAGDLKTFAVLQQLRHSLYLAGLLGGGEPR